MLLWEIVILAVVEGLTEYLPISSTGHLIATAAILGISHDEFVKNFNIIIQAGAIFAVLVLYWKRFFPIRLEFYKKLLVAFLPAAVIGLLVKDKIDAVLDSVIVVSWTLVLGGVVLIWADKYFSGDRDGKKTISDLTLTQCLSLGLIQCFAFLPGVSRAGATILGGMFLGLSKKEAAEFSFFLAVPTLTGASFIKILKVAKNIEGDQWSQIAIGTFLSWVVAILAIQFFLRLVQKFGFRHFGYYRIVFGAVLAFLIYQGIIT